MKKKLSVLIYTYLFICFIGILSVACKTDNDSEEIKTCKITFNSNDGSILPKTETQIFISGTSQYLKSISKLGFTRDGYSFIGWALRTDATVSKYSDGEKYTATSDITLYAVWSREQFTITFNSNDGVLPIKKTQSFTAGVPQSLKTISLLGFSKKGYSFIGWALNSNAIISKYSDGEKYTASSDITLYAVWSREQFTITFDSNGGSSVSKTSTQTFTSGISQSLETIASLGFMKDGYSFIGWATLPNSATAKYSDGMTYTASSDITLYAVWARNQFTITFNSNDGNSTPSTSKQKFDFGVSQALKSISLLGFSRDGYTFIGWAVSPYSNTPIYSDGESYTATADITLYAVWERKQFTITFNLNDDSESGLIVTQTFTYGSSQPLETIASLGFSRDSYSFVGWALTSNATKATYSDGELYTATSDITLYAIWIKQFKITFDSNDGSSVSRTSTQIFTAEISQSLETIANLGFKKDGYSFIGWATLPNSTAAKYSDGVTYKATSDITLYAVWAKQFTITFDANNGSSVSKTDTQIFISGISQPLKTVSSLGFSKENSVFTGWSLYKNKNISSYSDGDDFIADGDITLYATWFSYNSGDSNFSITKDDFTGTTFIEHNYFSDTLSKEPIEFYISKVSSGDYYLVVRFYYIGSDWIFFKKAILIDSKGNKFQRTFDYSKIIHKVQGSIVTERIDLPLGKGESLMDDIEKVFLDDNIRLRLTGDYYEDYELEVERVKALKEVLWLYNKLEISNSCE